jgi:hypothetical protein
VPYGSFVIHMRACRVDEESRSGVIVCSALPVVASVAFLGPPELVLLCATSVSSVSLWCSFLTFN